MSIGISAALAIACEESQDRPTVVTKARSQAVSTAHGMTAEEKATPTTRAEPKAEGKPASTRKLCNGQLSEPGSRITSDHATLSKAAAAGAVVPSGSSPFSSGKWTWVNFWAAWCVPCKEEIPRLKAWEKQLNQAGIPFELVFVSLDDDERQLKKFMNAQPIDGLKSTFWLKEGKDRESWLEGVGVEPDPQLPAHVIVDPKGLGRCVINGAVEDADYAQVKALLGA